VGEAIVIKGLAEELRMAFPDKRLVISTITATGNRIAQGIAKKRDFVTYLPLDFSFIIRNFVDKINPSMFIVAETEIWPNLISHLYRRNIPIVVVNGRISDRSYKGYTVINFLVQSVFNKINLFCVQTQTDGKRLVNLGVAEEKIQITGNMKFDLKDYASLKRDYADYRLKLGLNHEDKLLVAGSTHAGEEESLLDTYKNLLKDYPNLRLLIAPRHPERTTEIEKIVIKYGFASMRISQLGGSTGQRVNGSTVFILDTVGELMNYYAIGEIVFVGGSLIKKGGHNILEPASLEKPILFGPYMFNFRDIADLFLENKAGILVYNRADLEKNIRDLLDNAHKRMELGRKARDLIWQNQGATRRNLEGILETVSKK
jgi:3-deoxy-D-manno-octulosonic-acid transferase